LLVGEQSPTTIISNIEGLSSFKQASTFL